MKIKIYFLLELLLLIGFCISQHKESCTSPIYCQGDILHLVQTNKIFNDSKTFVDMALIYPVNETQLHFYNMMAETDEHPTREQILEFVHQHFVSIGELEEFYPRDFKPEPKIIKEISDPVVRAFAKSIVSIWPSLTRKVNYHVIEHPDTHSLIPVDNPFIIPGGRFKEYYYWDTYWILKGLLLSDMTETARGVIQNLLSMVERYGFIPNGGRIYYLNRSQPPVLTVMVADYVKYTKDFEFLRSNLKTLETELQFWLTKRVSAVHKDGETYHLAHYDSSSDTPRPESYFEDIETCSVLKNEEEKLECYTDLKSGAESGMDFTSRWLFNKHDLHDKELSNIHTRRVIPVDLNAFLYKDFTTMVKFHMIFQELNEAKYWQNIADRWKLAIEKVLYNEEDGTWYDYDLKLGQPRKGFYPSNIIPLWAGAFNESVRAERGHRTVEYLRKHGLLGYKVGLPASLLPTGQQWDFPNAWSPYQNLVIIGLDKSGNPEAQEVARDFAHKWVSSNIHAYHENKVMFEKYNARNIGQYGGGGEYNIQAGFGWSNGCILELINLYFRAKTRKSIGGF